MDRALVEYQDGQNERSENCHIRVFTPTDDTNNDELQSWSWDNFIQKLMNNFQISPALIQEVALLKRRSETFELHRKLSNNPFETEPAVLDRIVDTRRRARQIAGYTCVVEYLFAEPRIDRHFYYGEMLSALTSNPTCSLRIVDVGCCVGTDVRKLIIDGCLTSSITAVDKEEKFFDLGKRLYNEPHDGPNITFVKADLLSPNFSEQVTDIKGSFDFVHSANVIHLFREEDQLVFLRNLCSLVKPGGIVLGRQVGESEGSLTEGVQLEGKGNRYTLLGFMRLLQKAVDWSTITATYSARLVDYDELRLMQAYKRSSLEWLVRSPGCS